MQDENAIEAQQSPRPIRTSSFVKNKSEPSPQLLESTALHTITNLPRAHSRTYPAPGSGKGKQAHEQKKPQARSLMESSTGHPHQNTQPSPDSQPSPKQHLYEEIPVSEQDLETLRALEEALEAVKQSVAQLLRESAREETALEETRRDFKKEQDAWAKQEEQDELELEELDEQAGTIQQEHTKLENEIFYLSLEMEERNQEVETLAKKLKSYDEETCEELSESPLQAKQREVAQLEELMDKQMDILVETSERWKKVQLTDVCEYYSLAAKIRERKSRIQDLKSELELEDMDTDLEAILGMSIEEEFEVLKSRHSVSKGSDFDKKMTARQVELKARYDREHASAKKVHSAALDQINLRTLTHYSRLTESKKAIMRAKSSIEESKKAFEQAQQEVLQVRSEKETRLREIAEVAKLLATLS
ncbi:hypothetical protein BGZ70_007855 [Mortierella alpina]|uniref:Uncharacterized protein n=1 Tax=Mortierella alpina TaxID=64518 RepID=A0A9P6J4X6_MORAP|nr:hypothetical protein BGZ70_007855 [Mortierella alpina]